jgi:DNA (cytosine-5)-methyltransferase 1
MRYGSICSGIEAATVAFAPLGWEPVFFAEIDPFCCALLQHHYPTVPNAGDFTRIGKETPVGPIDLVIGGPPCQSFSVAGRRGGLADPRGNLTLEYFALLDRLRPRWMVYENVPGLLSDNHGRTFGTCLGLLAELGYGFAYRIFNAEYAGVPQRRHRVFLVACLGDWRPPAAVLFERHSLSGYSPPRRETGQDVAVCLTPGTDRQGGSVEHRCDDDVSLVGFRVTSNDGAYAMDNCCHTLTCLTDLSALLVPFDTTQITSKENRSQPQPGSACHPLTGTGHAPAVAAQHPARGAVIPLQYAEQATRDQRDNGMGIAHAGAPMYTLECTRQHGVMSESGVTVRRLTPRETERLQGLPDNYTLIPYRGKPAKDGPRYRAIGNSFAVPVVRWIAQRIAKVEQVLTVDLEKERS